MGLSGQELSSPTNFCCKKKKNYTLEDRTTLIDNSKILGETIKQVFWQTLINDQKLKLKLQINEFVIEGLLNTGSNATIISPKS